MKAPQLDVIDPRGIVCSQVVQTADGALRMALNASQSQQTLVVALSVRVFRIRRAAHRLCHR